MSLSRKINNIALLVNSFGWILLMIGIPYVHYLNQWTWLEAVVHFWPSLTFMGIGTFCTLLARSKAST